jgi:hypothetical protein
LNPLSWTDVLKIFIQNPTPQVIAASMVVLLVAMPIAANAWMIHEFSLASERIEISVNHLIDEVRLLVRLSISKP